MSLPGRPQEEACSSGLQPLQAYSDEQAARRDVELSKSNILLIAQPELAKPF